MNVLKAAGAILAMVFTAGATLTMWVFSAAALANANDASYQRVRLWVIGFSLLALAGIGAGIWMLMDRRYALSAVVSLVPAAVMCLALVWQLVRPV